MADHEKPDQLPWHLDTPHGRFAVRATTAFVQHQVVWELDGRIVAEKKAGDDTMTVSPEDEELGKLRLTFDWLGRCRRITWLDGSGGVAGEVGLGGTDLEPPEGSYAARREARIRENPRRFAAIAVATGIGRVVVPILVALIGVRIAVHVPWPDIDLPDLPDLPRIPWPDVDLPAVPWPDWSVPGWLAWILDTVRYVWPVVLAAVLANNEIRRRRRQDELRRAAQTERTPSGAPSQGSKPSSTPDQEATSASDGEASA